VVRFATEQMHQVISSALMCYGNERLLRTHMTPDTWGLFAEEIRKLKEQASHLDDRPESARMTQARQTLAVHSARLLEQVLTPEQTGDLRPDSATIAADTRRALTWCLEEGRRQAKEEQTEAAAGRSAGRLGLEVEQYQMRRADLRTVSRLKRRTAEFLTPLMACAHDLSRTDLHLIVSLLPHAADYPAVIITRRAVQAHTSSPLPHQPGPPDLTHLTSRTPHLPTGPMSLMLADADAKEARDLLNTLAYYTSKWNWDPDPEALRAEDAADPALIGLWSTMFARSRTGVRSSPVLMRGVHPESS